MKTRTILALCGTAIAAETMAALMYTIRGLLPDIATKILIVILVIAGLTALYTITALIKRIHAVITDIRLKQLEKQEREQRMAMDKEDHEMRMLSMRADIHVKLSRAYADPNGNYPVLLPGTFVSPVEMAGNVMLLPPGQMKGISAPAATENKMLPPAVPVPTAPLFREIMPYIQGEKVVIACDQNGVVSGEVKDWLSTLIVGMPGMGKSTALYFFIAQLMMLTARFQVLDPHASLVSLKNMLPYVSRVDACIQTASLIETELERRMDRYETNDGVCLDDHYMLIVDELPAIADREQQLTKAMDKEEKAGFRSLIDVLRRVVCEGRKYKMYCMVVGQSIPATVLPTIARDNMSSRYVFNCSPSHASMAGLDKNTIDTFLPRLEKSVGRCIVAPSRMKPFIGAIPQTTVDDLRYVIQSTGYARDGWDNTVNAETDRSESVNDRKQVLEPMEALHGNVYAFPKTPILAPETVISESVNTETDLPEGVNAHELEQIQAAYQAGWSLRHIASLVKMEGRNYWKFKAACAYLGIGPQADAV